MSYGYGLTTKRLSGGRSLDFNCTTAREKVRRPVAGSRSFGRSSVSSPQRKPDSISVSTRSRMSSLGSAACIRSNCSAVMICFGFRGRWGRLHALDQLWAILGRTHRLQANLGALPRHGVQCPDLVLHSNDEGAEKDYERHRILDEVTSSILVSPTITAGQRPLSRQARGSLPRS